MVRDDHRELELLKSLEKGNIDERQPIALAGR
jgi:hypothetical protein